MKVVILAGGFGTRISEESYLKPKPMIEIGEKPILWHIIKLYFYYGFNDFVICVSFKGYMIKQYFTKNNEMTIHNNVAEPWKVTIVDTGLKTQTGGCIKRVQKYIGDEPFFLTYGDNKLLAFYKEIGKLATMTATRPGGRFGVLELDDTGNTTRFREKTVEDGGWINAGFIVPEPKVFDYISNREDEVFERDPLEHISAEGMFNSNNATWMVWENGNNK